MSDHDLSSLPLQPSYLEVFSRLHLCLADSKLSPLYELIKNILEHEFSSICWSIPNSSSHHRWDMHWTCDQSGQQANCVFFFYQEALSNNNNLIIECQLRQGDRSLFSIYWQRIKMLLCEEGIQKNLFRCNCSGSNGAKTSSIDDLNVLENIIIDKNNDNNNHQHVAVGLAQHFMNSFPGHAQDALLAVVGSADEDLFALFSSHPAELNLFIQMTQAVLETNHLSWHIPIYQFWKKCKQSRSISDSAKINTLISVLLFTPPLQKFNSDDNNNQKIDNGDNNKHDIFVPLYEQQLARLRSELLI